MLDANELTAAHDTSTYLSTCRTPTWHQHDTTYTLFIFLISRRTTSTACPLVTNTSLVSKTTTHDEKEEMVSMAKSYRKLHPRNNIPRRGRTQCCVGQALKLTRHSFLSGTPKSERWIRSLLLAGGHRLVIRANCLLDYCVRRQEG